MKLFYCDIKVQIQLQKANVAVLNQLGYILSKQGYQHFPYYEVQSSRSFITIAQNTFVTKKLFKGFINSTLENTKMQKLISKLKYYKALNITKHERNSGA